MDRRRCLRLASAAAFGAGLAGSRPGLAAVTCEPGFLPEVQECEAGLQTKLAHVAAAASGGQHLDQWCWAASIEMVFRYYGFVVPQEMVVKETWGEIVNLPAEARTIMANLNRSWRDEKGRSFRVTGDTASANPLTAVEDLTHDMPLILGTQGHVMVLTAVRYLEEPGGEVGEVVLATVRDPWPNRGKRDLSAEEWYATDFLARVRVYPE